MRGAIALAVREEKWTIPKAAPTGFIGLGTMARADGPQSGAGWRTADCLEPVPVEMHDPGAGRGCRRRPTPQIFFPAATS